MRVNQHQRTVALIILAVIVGAILVAALVPSREPQYEGKPLSYWVDQLWTQPERHTECNKAIQTIGPQAVPFLIQQARRQDSPYERLSRFTWAKLPAVLQRRIPQPAPVSYDLHRKIGFVLGLIGQPALPQLVPALKDHNDGVRLVAVEAMGSIAPKSDTVVRLVAKLLNDSNALTRVNAALALGVMKPNSVLAVPDLIRALRDSDVGPQPRMTVAVRANAARVLGEIGPEARGATPELRKLLNTGDSYTRQQAAVALWRIDHATNVVAVLVAELQSDDVFPDRRRAILSALGEMGPAAKAASTTVAKMGQREDEFGPRFTVPAELRQLAREVLAKIDPDRAMSIGAQTP
jgi:HEAT repeat protein